jgi:hypothetical protein
MMWSFRKPPDTRIAAILSWQSRLPFSTQGLHANPSFYPWSPLAGGLLWLAVVLFRAPSPFDPDWAKASLMLVPLVLLPMVLSLLDDPAAGETHQRAWRLAGTLQFGAALLLGSSLLLSQGMLAAALAAPWVVVTGLLAVCGVVRLWQHRQGPMHECSINAGLAFLMVGSLWAVLDRAGIQPLGFEPVIVLLTAIHFHYAGFLLPLLTGLAGRQISGIAPRVAAGGVVVAVPLTAIGITATQLGFAPLLECGFAALLASAGTLTAWLYFRLSLARRVPKSVRVLWLLAATSLTVGMALAATYGMRFYVDVRWLDIPWMRAAHGTLNSLGFSLPAILGWMLLNRPENRTFPQPTSRAPLDAVTVECCNKGVSA